MTQILIGTSKSNIKIINLECEYSNSEYIFVFKKTHFPDTFKSWFDGNQLFIQRLDADADCGWCHRHIGFIQKSIYSITPYSIIPLNIFQTWVTLDLPPKMKQTVENVQFQNPEFKYHLFDDNMCRDFIKQYFDADVLYTYDKLIPGAYKADLWRLCILYIHGGIYLDIKFYCVNGFKLIELTDKEYWVRDRDIVGGDHGIYNALMVCMPYNNILYKCIYAIVENVKNNFYDNLSKNALKISGPLLISNYFYQHVIKQFELDFTGMHICRNNDNILEEYIEYRKERRHIYNIRNCHNYIEYYSKGCVYNYPKLLYKNIIDLLNTLITKVNDIKCYYAKLSE